MIAPGTRLGPYEIVAPLGAGGMGEVYRARDTRLGREVAVKVLPTRFAASREARERFEREAKAVAALSHPNILALHDVGHEGETAFAVTELLEGQTLRQALAPGKLAPRRTIEICAQIAHGLAAAHEKGIVHRDIKPENVFITRTGHVKILDFGVAKVTLAEDDSGVSSSLEVPTGATEPGRVLGTIGYLSPEQARGRPADARSDIFSLGAVLYEMLSGAKAFERDTSADTLSAILKEDPPELTQTNPSIPTALDRITRHCLEKAPERRFQSARDLAFNLEAVSTESVTGRIVLAESPVRRLPGARALALGAAVLLAAIGGYLLGRTGGSPVPSPRLTFQRLTSQPGIEIKPALSPDGETVAFVSTASGNRDIWIQKVGSDKAINLTADSPAAETDPAFSPDGSLIAFHSERDGGGLFVMGQLGESVRRLTSAGYSPDWTPDGKEIVYADEEINTPLGRNRSHVWAVDVASGRTRPLVAVDAVEPAVSPHGLRVAFWGLKGDTARRDVYTVPLSGLREGESPLPVTDDAAVDFSPFWSADGRHLYFGSDRGGSFNLWRVPIDEKSGRVKGEPEPVTLPTTWSGIFPGSFRGSRNGRRIAFTAAAELMTIERQALEPSSLRVAGPPVILRRGSTMLSDLEVSPDGSTLAARTQGMTESLCVLPADGSSLRQITRDGFRNRGPRWSADGRRIYFYSSRGGDYGVWTIAPDGSDPAPVGSLPPAHYSFPVLSPDGTRIALGSPAAHVAVAPLGSNESGPAPSAVGIQAKWAWDWSSDGTRLLAARVGATAASGLLLCSASAGTCETLVPRAEQGRFLSGGKAVAYIERGEIFVLDLATRASRLLVPATLDAPITRFCPSPDGAALFILRDVSEGDIWVGTFPAGQ